MATHGDRFRADAKALDAFTLLFLKGLFCPTLKFSAISGPVSYEVNSILFKHSGATLNYASMTFKVL